MLYNIFSADKNAIIILHHIDFYHGHCHKNAGNQSPQAI
uniref:Uncharacterized protein n=1 Tax=Rhizophora mucronata TaxID=61149 RepID=A0A2P2QWW5_RHIMU